MFYPKNVYILLLLFYYYVGRSDTLKHHDEVECNPSNKEVKGAKKLEQLLQKEKEDEDHRKESTLKDWAGDANKDFNLEIMKTFTTMSNADNPFCFKSYLTQNSYIDECQIADLEGHKTADSLLAAFTNGRLGNQMSAFATIYALSKILSLDIVLMKSQYDYFKPYFPNISEDLVVEKRFCDHCKFRWIQRGPKWFKTVISRQAKIRKGLALTLPSYPNEPEIYKDYLDELKEKFDLAEKYKEMAKSRISEILTDLKINKNNDFLLIGVHFRGTDFAAIMKTKFRNAKVGSNYYQKAFRFCREKFPDRKIVYLIVTDDPVLAKAILQYDKVSNNINDIFVLAGSQRDTSLSDIDAIGLDFGLLTLCQHLVISYSTFGMWAGHLNSGMTIMSLGLEGMEEKVKNANLTNWHFFTDD